MVLLSIQCAFVGLAGSLFDVEIDNGATVSRLKHDIKWESANALKDVDAHQLQLFLAKTRGGAWLRDADPSVLELKKGRVHPDIQTMVDGEMMEQAWTLRRCWKRIACAP
ncbi:hypothetical protein PHYSODRAFT_511899 [Phytophthora sojae]|uniref:Crinkler effector protein N-terminal domain-containing protein n=1 Tax=Phytophthora sojae (strain P6497) TaxID=1094619 RepID=G4ZQY3_PHYSP|nr:hypothetical protein PHYSODRAFT_511899 [Phytophthora sojae]EGZ13931.1 hypothetical protein PHYSODRAFT_511899 [Phytophthora sojae]|eukprot:XP_009531360.1 hypothetical protein PHYSODRAFT_511899 [Phytophthora sojae]